MVFPDPGVAPVIPPLIAPIVHVKLLDAVDVRLIFGEVPLQIVAVAGEFTTGVGLTVTVII